MAVPAEFKSAIGIKLIEYAPMNVLEFSTTYGRSAKSTEVDGYVIRYPDGYVSWSPKSVFEKAYFPIETSENLSPEDIENFVSFTGGDYKAMTKTTVQQAVSVTGYEYLETSPCVNPKTYNHSTGVGYACDKIRDKVWEGLGFVMQWAKNGITPKPSIGTEPEGSSFKTLVSKFVSGTSIEDVLDDDAPATNTEKRVWVEGTVDEAGHWEDL